MAVYLDHNATTPMHEKVLEAMLPFMGKSNANPSSLHAPGRAQRDAIERARYQVAQLVDARPEQVVFTSGGTEANNLLIKGMSHVAGAHFAVSAIEHQSIIEPVKSIVDQCHVDVIAVNHRGEITPDALMSVINNDTRLVSIMSANNETGVIQDISTLASSVSDKNIWFHTDASQSAGKVKVSFVDSGVDAMTISSHKIYGPMGVGALIVNKQMPIKPIILGGSHEKGMRAGTENVPAIVGFGMASELAYKELKHRAEHVLSLRNALQDRLTAFKDVEIFSANANRLPNTLQFGVYGFDGETLLMQLDRSGIAVSSGSACTSGKTEPSHVLKAMNVPTELALSAVRVSFGKDNTMSDVDEFIKVFAKILEMKQSSLMMAATI